MDEMRDFYDLRGGVRGKYYDAYWSNVTTSNSIGTFSTPNFHLVEPVIERVWLPSGSKPSWRRGIWG